MSLRHCKDYRCFVIQWQINSSRGLGIIFKIIKSTIKLIPLARRGFLLTNPMTQDKRFYLTKEGLEKIKREYEELRKLKFSKTKGEVPKILHSEDLNPEYLSFQEELSFLGSRIAELEYIIKNAKLISFPPRGKQKIINLGAEILVEVDGQSDEFKIVGTLEANPAVGKISNESPVGQALLGHKVGDEVIVSSPIKTIYKIKKVRYLS